MAARSMPGPIPNWNGLRAKVLKAQGVSATGALSLWHLDVAVLAAIGHETHALIERQRARVVEGAGVDQQLRDRMRPCIERGLIEEVKAQMAPDEIPAAMPK